MRNIKPKKKARPRIDLAAAPLEEENDRPGYRRGFGERRGGATTTRVVSAELVLVASESAGNGEALRQDHDRRMGDIDDVEQPEQATASPDAASA